MKPKMRTCLWCGDGIKPCACQLMSQQRVSAGFIKRPCGCRFQHETTCEHHGIEKNSRKVIE